MNQNCIHEEGKRRFNLGNACYHLRVGVAQYSV
jgi:hypothetical protein